MKKMKRNLVLIFILICISLCGCTAAGEGDEAFSNWAEGAEPVSLLKEYVETVTDEKSEDFIPPEDRIAVFDLDGTLYCETFPIYGEWLLFADYVLNTPDYEAPEDIRAVAKELEEIKSASDIPSYMEQTHINAHAAAFAGMSIDDYFDLVEKFKNTEAEGFEGLKRGDAFYLPMLETVEYLTANDFIIYICSGTNRFTVRALIDDVIDIPARQVIGSDFTIASSNQGEEDSMHYNFTEEDELLMGDTVITKNVRMSKVAQLEQELGQKPVVVFGNSMGDVSMAVYAQEGNQYLTEVFFLLCDDITREYGNEAKAKKIADLCKEKGWNTISMAKDWETVFGEDVTKK